jgi:hypothetical protein
VRLVNPLVGVFLNDRVFSAKNLPLLGTVPALKKGDRDEDDDGLLAVASLDLEIPGVSIMPPSAHRLSQLTCSVYVCVPGLRESFTGNEARSYH